jgi:hypothetical protein
MRLEHTGGYPLGLTRAEAHALLRCASLTPRQSKAVGAAQGVSPLDTTDVIDTIKPGLRETRPASVLPWLEEDAVAGTDDLDRRTLPLAEADVSVT